MQAFFNSFPIFLMFKFFPQENAISMPILGMTFYDFSWAWYCHTFLRKRYTASIPNTIEARDAPNKGGIPYTKDRGATI